MALILNLSTQNEKKKLRVRLILGSQVCVAIPLKFCHWNNKNDVFRENKWFHQKNDQWSWNKPRSSNVFDIHNLYESQGQPNWYHFGPFLLIFGEPWWKLVGPSRHQLVRNTSYFVSKKIHHLIAQEISNGYS